MASPDTDELATVPFAARSPEAGSPEAKTAPQQRVEPPGSQDAESAQERVEQPDSLRGERTGAVDSPGAETALRERAEVADSRRAEARGERAGLADSPGAETAPQERGEMPDSLRARAEVADSLAAEETAPQERAEPERIEPESTAPEAPARAKDGGRWWRGFTGSLAAGLTVLAVGVLVVAGICLYTDAPGPGATLLIGHPIAAVLAVLAQRVADRRNGLPAIGAGVAVVLFTVSALTLFWLT